MAGPDGLASWRMEHTTASALCVTRANHPGRRPTRYIRTGTYIHARMAISQSVSQSVYYIPYRYNHHSIDKCILMAHLLVNVYVR